MVRSFEARRVVGARAKGEREKERETSFLFFCVCVKERERVQNHPFFLLQLQKEE